MIDLKKINEQVEETTKLTKDGFTTASPLLVESVIEGSVSIHKLNISGLNIEVQIEGTAFQILVRNSYSGILHYGCFEKGGDIDSEICKLIASYYGERE